MENINKFTKAIEQIFDSIFLNLSTDGKKFDT